MEDNGSKVVDTGTLVRKVTKAVVLFLLGTYFVDLLLSANINNYLNPQWAWTSAVAAGFCFLLGMVGAYSTWKEWDEERFNRRSAASVRAGSSLGHEHQGHDHDHEGHRHAALSWPVLAILVIPLALGKGVPSKALGADTLSNSTGTTVQAAIERAGPAAGDHPEVWNIWDWQRTYYANIHPESWFNGKTGDMTGFVFHPPGLDPGEFVLARYVMRHCAADAFGVGMLVKYAGGESIPTDTWVRVTGIMAIEQAFGEPTLLIHPTTLTKLGQPESPYIYPSFYALPKT